MKIFKYLIYIILTPIFVVIFYITLSYILSLFPHNSTISSKNRDESIYILYGTMHSDIIIDIDDLDKNWSKLLPRVIKNRQRGYLSFGWGDRDTYLNTPNWSDLEFYTAIKAIFVNTPSVMHVEYYSRIHRYKYLKEIKITKPQLQKIEKTILESFGGVPTFTNRGYGYNDKFYDSPYKYNLIHTCNTWTGDTLRDANITMSYWTPISYNVINALP